MFDDVEKYVDQFLEELGEYDEDEFACLRDKVYARVEALPERTKEIFKAVVLNNLTYQQVGERFGITVNTVKTLYYRALKQLKEELGVTVAPERAVWIAQSFFTPTGKKQRYHELCTYFTVDASGTDLITRGDRFDSPNEPSVHFAWFPFEELPYIDLRPAFLKTEVQNLPEHTQFITLGD